MPVDIKAEQVAEEQGRFSPEQPENSFDLLDLATLLAARKRFILLFSLALAVITYIVLWIVPPTYTAKATMLPPQKDSASSALLGELGGLSSLMSGGSGAASMLGLKNPDDLYIGLLQSETVEDNIVRRFHLQQVYHCKRLSDARHQLESHTKILAEKSSLISIAVKDHHPDRAASLANAYIDELHDLLSGLAVTEAGQRRMFFQQEMEQEKDRLADAEVALEKIEKKTGIIQPQGQAQAVIATIMQIQAQISAREVELNALRMSSTSQNPQVLTLQSQIQGLRDQLANFKKGHPGSAALAGDVLTPTSEVPQASLEYIRGMRDVKYHETLFELMARQYEMARVDEAKQSRIIQVVDPALVPDRRSWPERTLLALLALILGVMFSCFWVLLRGFYDARMQDPVLAAKVARLRQNLRMKDAS